ncbi:MAG: hypothetical protein J0H66_04275 [Solirubrobacterales bacterium]|nr:hypothetical protein [Solirubrobacterales bacterium]OJU96292.1 MAG: hypothetical protein BGO23_01940 [Solirubrobacterales bacterium 67-14]
MLESSLIDLKGKRLGKWERGLLLDCGVIGQRTGIPIRVEGGTRAQNVAVRRAAKNLEATGLLITHKLRRASVIYDERLAMPIYRDGAFYRRVSPKRIHWTDCLAGWLSPFGAGVRVEYLPELRGQRPIRWTSERLRNAEHIGFTEYVSAPVLDAADVEGTQEAFARTSPINKAMKRIGPPGAEENPGRWTSAINCAVRELGSKGSVDLWTRSVEIFKSDETDAQLLQRGPQRATYRGRKTAKPGQLQKRRRELI